MVGCDGVGVGRRGWAWAMLGLRYPSHIYMRVAQTKRRAGEVQGKGMQNT